MERLRLALLGCDAPRELDPERFQVLGSVEHWHELVTLAPQLVLVGYADAADALSRAEQCAQALPGASAVLVGPAIEAACIVTAMRQGTRDVIPLGDAEALRAALDRAWRSYYSWAERAVGQAPQEREGTIIVVHSPKGGSGKTSLALNLAASLGTQAGKSVALVDLALQAGDLDLALDLKPQASWADLATRRDFGPEEVEAALVAHRSGLRLLAAPRQAAEGELVSPQTVEKALRLLRQRHPFVIVDTASALDEAALRAMELADRILLPLPLTLPALRRMQRGIELWELLGITAAKLILVAWEPKGDCSLAEAEQVLGKPIAHRLPHAPQEIESALNAGEPLATLKPQGAYAKAIAAIAHALGGERPAASRASLIARWWDAKRRTGHVSKQQA